MISQMPNKSSLLFVTTNKHSIPANSVWQYGDLLLHQETARKGQELTGALQQHWPNQSEQKQIIAGERERISSRTWPAFLESGSKLKHCSYALIAAGMFPASLCSTPAKTQNRLEIVGKESFFFLFTI
jgi:hypothetical protein